jgi:uncharacterized membrane protein
MPRRILYGALFASLALNVFIGGAFVGAHLQKPREPAPAPLAPVGQRNPVIAAVRALPPQYQQVWRDQNPEFARTYGPKAKEARRLARETMLGFGSEPFNAEAALAELARARDLEHEARVAMDHRLVTFAASLPPAERKAFGEELARPRLGRGGAGKGDGRTLPDR